MYAIPSYSDNPVADSFRAYERGAKEAAERAAHVEAIKGQFLTDAAGDLNAPSLLARPVRDYRSGVATMRAQRVWEVVYGALDYSDFSREAVALLCKAAAGENISTRAADLLERIAENFADMEAA